MGNLNVEFFPTGFLLANRKGAEFQALGSAV